MHDRAARQYKTLHRVEHPGHARFLTFSCAGRLPLFHDDASKRVFANALARARERYSFRLFAWVVMPEHVHLLLFPKLPEWPVERVLWGLKRGVAQSILHDWRLARPEIIRRIHERTGDTRFWMRGGGYDRNVWDSHELPEKIKYINDNPVRRGLVARPEDWAWSSARWYAGFREGGVTIDPVR